MKGDLKREICSTQKLNIEKREMGAEKQEAKFQKESIEIARIFDFMLLPGNICFDFEP